MRNVGADRDADRGDVVVLRVPPARRMPTPPRQHRRRRHPAQESDRRLAVRREDPVAVLEGVHRARLHRLVVPKDRVRTDTSLPVVDKRAFVVGAQQHHRAEEVEQLLLAEAVDLTVAGAVRVADHAPQIAFGGKNLRHCSEIIQE